MKNEIEILKRIEGDTHPDFNDVATLAGILREHLEGGDHDCSYCSERAEVAEAKLAEVAQRLAVHEDDQMALIEASEAQRAKDLVREATIEECACFVEGIADVPSRSG